MARSRASLAPMPSRARPSAAPSSRPRSTVLRRARAVAKAARERKAEEVVILDLRRLGSYTDMLVIASGGSTRQVEAIAESVVQYIKKKARSAPLGVEGLPEARWALIDWGDIVIHVFLDETRHFYDLDGLWMDAPRVPLTPTPRQKGARGQHERKAVSGNSQTR